MAQKTLILYSEAQNIRADIIINTRGGCKILLGETSNSPDLTEVVTKCPV